MMTEAKMYGIKNEIIGLKKAIDELQTVISVMGNEMAMLQRHIIGIELETGIKGARMFIKHTTKKGNTVEKRQENKDK